jgi:integrase
MALFKRTNSKYWWMKFTFDGQLIQQSTQVANNRDAQTVESAYRTQLALGKIGIKPQPKAPTFEKAMADFLEWLKIEHSTKPRTFTRYYYSCQVLSKFFSKVKINQINSKDIEKFVVERSRQKSHKTGKPVERKTVNFDLFTLKMMFKRLVDSKILREDPARTVKQLSENEPPFHVITEMEEKTYLLACPQPLQDVAAIILETGMRPNELYSLKRESVFLDKNFLRVESGKTKAARRKVFLTKKAHLILSRRLQKFDGDYVFPQNDINGSKATPDLGVFHLKTINQLGFSFRLYDCRHTFATRTLESGTDLITLASMLGHANLKMVMRYAHPSENHQAAAIRRLEDAGEKKAKAV